MFELSKAGLPISKKYPLKGTDLLSKERFVSFTQCSGQASEKESLDILQVLLLTEKGHVYSLCPVLTSIMVFKEDYFTQILLQLEDMVQCGNPHLNKLAISFKKTKATQFIQN
jgi:hypothetical protein